VRGRAPELARRQVHHLRRLGLGRGPALPVLLLLKNGGQRGWLLHRGRRASVLDVRVERLGLAPELCLQVARNGAVLRVAELVTLSGLAVLVVAALGGVIRYFTHALAVLAKGIAADSVRHPYPCRQGLLIFLLA